MFFIEANIGRGVSASVARRNIVKIRRALNMDPTVFWFEINEDNPQVDEASLIKQTWRRYDHSGIEGKEPISTPKHLFDVLDFKRVKIMDGVPRSAPGGASPTRYVNRVRVLKNFVDGPISLIGTHFPNFDPDDPRMKACVERLRDVVDEAVSDGDAVVWAADPNMNRPGVMPKVHLRERRLFDYGNDCMGIIQSRKVKIVPQGKGTINLTIDGHNAHWANLNILDR